MNKLIKFLAKYSLIGNPVNNIVVRIMFNFLQLFVLKSQNFRVLKIEFLQIRHFFKACSETTIGSRKSKIH